METQIKRCTNSTVSLLEFWEDSYVAALRPAFYFFKKLTVISIKQKSTEAYYRYASANQHAPGVRVPLLSLSSLDDPIVAVSTVPHEAAAENGWLVFVTTNHGGHLGETQLHLLSLNM